MLANIDVEATQARKFKSKRSRVLLDGREILGKPDWKQRKAELWARCGGRCEHEDHVQDSFAPRDTPKLLHIRCFRVAHDPHHIIPRSKKRDDRLSNLQALCRFHHRLVDQRKIGGRK